MSIVPSRASTNRDVTNDVQIHYANAASNHGWLVKDDDEPNMSSGETQFFGSRTHPEAAKNPVLKVTYCQ